MKSKRTFAFIIWDCDGVYKISSQELQNTPSLFPSCPSLCTLVWLCSFEINPSGIHLKSSLGSFIWTEMLVLLVSVFLLLAIAMLARLLLTLLKINSEVTGCLFVFLIVFAFVFANTPTWRSPPRSPGPCSPSPPPLNVAPLSCSPTCKYANIQICKKCKMLYNLQICKKMQNVLQPASMQKKWKMFSNL